MTEGVKELIGAIASGDSIAIEQAFNNEMAERISNRLDDMRVQVAQNMFKEQVEEVELSEEEIIDEMINEVLGKSEPASAWIKDFVDSEDPKFAGKSKEKRKQMALAAYYAKQRNEELDVNEILDYINEDEEVLAELSKATLTSYANKASNDRAEHKKKADAGMKDYEDKGGQGSGYDKYEYHSDKADKRKAGVDKAYKKLAKEEVESLEEQMTRKHFQQVADVIKAHPDQEKRNELAKHHAEIFKASNPRFDHSRFYAAAGANIK